MEYFVSYFAKTKFGRSKICNCITETEKPIVSGNDVDELTDSIKKDGNYRTVVVLNIKELKI